jgi:hypothetical protein
MMVVSDLPRHAALRRPQERDRAMAEHVIRFELILCAIQPDRLSRDAKG